MAAMWGPLTSHKGRCLISDMVGSLGVFFGGCTSCFLVGSAIFDVENG